MNQKKWEAICDGCGKCCDITHTGIACPQLGPGNRCKVYEKRLTTELCLKVTPDNVLHLHKIKVLPDSCAYVRWKHGLPKLEVPEHPLLPFLLAHPNIQKKYIENRDRYFRNMDAASSGET